jgi:Uma2 family endonuclease
MDRDTFSAVTERPAVDYAHLPGEEHNPLMESTEHVQWTTMLLNAATNTLAGSGDLVTGNVPFSPDDGGPHTAPDIMVIPGAAGRQFGRYTPGVDGPMPSVAIEIVSPSNSKAEIRRRCTRLLNLGVGEVYVLDPRRQTVVRVEQGGEDWRESNAVATYSPGLRLSFTTIDGHLAVCCPGGRTVRPGDDPFGWLLDEMNRADALLNELADRDEKIAKRDATIAEQLKELEALRSQRH